MRSARSLTRFAAILGATSALLIGAQRAAAGQGQKPIGLVVVAHGADAPWNARVRETVAAVQWPHGPVRTVFLMGSEAATASWDSATGALERAGVRGMVVVPFMVSSHGSHVRQIEYYAGLRAELPEELSSMVHDHGAHTAPSVPVRVTAALDRAPELGEALLSRWRELPDADRRRPVMLIAHGPNGDADAKQWEADILAATATLAAHLHGRPLRVGLLRDDAPAAVRAAAVAAIRDTVSALARRYSDSVTVLPVLISTGSVNTVSIPADIRGLPVTYHALGLAPHPALARWIERVTAPTTSSSP